MRVLAIGNQNESSEPKIESAGDPGFTRTIQLMLRVSANLTPFVDAKTLEGARFCRAASELRATLYHELGVTFPPIQIAGNMPLHDGDYMLYVNEVPVTTGHIRTDALLINQCAHDALAYGIKGEDATNPANRRPACWISKNQRERAQSAGLEIWDTLDILLLHLTHFMRKQAREFIGIAEVQWKLERLKPLYPSLVEGVTPNPLSLRELTEVLQRLVEEEISIRDLKSILQALKQSVRAKNDIPTLVEQVRIALKETICYRITHGGPLLLVYQLSPEIEDVFRKSVRQGGLGPYVAMGANMIEQIMKATHGEIGSLPATAQPPVILAASDIRRFVKRLLDHRFPEVTVLSYEQLSSRVTLQPLGSITLPATPTH